MDWNVLLGWGDHTAEKFSAVQTTFHLLMGTTGQTITIDLAIVKNRRTCFVLLIMQYQKLNDVVGPLYHLLLMFQNTFSVGTTVFLVPGLALKEFEQIILLHTEIEGDTKSLFRFFLDAERGSSPAMQQIRQYAWGTKQTINELLDHMDWGYLYGTADYTACLKKELRFN